MDDADFDGTRVLERLAEVGRLDAFAAAVDRDDVERAATILRRAGLDAPTIAIVIAKIEAGDLEP